jgi:Fe-S-cluster containining protein
VQDGSGRRLIKALARWNFYLSLWTTRALGRLRGEPRFVLGGACRRAAQCCEAPAIQVGRLIWYVPRLRRLFLWWQEKVNGFVLTGQHRDQRVLIFECTHFDRATRSCDSYASRPGMCRDYPRALLHQPNPELLPSCGYRPVARNARQLREALSAKALTPEQMARLERELHLEE